MEADLIGRGTIGALLDVCNERLRQKLEEGWTEEHDDEHVNQEMADAAAAYAYSGVDAQLWPMSWDAKWYKPGNRRRDLIKAAALLVAEIERLDRLA